VVVADVDPPFVGVDVVDAVGDGFGYLRVGEVVGPYPGRFALGFPFAAPVGVVADDLFLR
jgi:hypothetical protein